MVKDTALNIIQTYYVLKLLTLRSDNEIFISNYNTSFDVPLYNVGDLI